jgi:hypothetical protein
MLPPNELVLWTMLAVSVALTAVWPLSERRHFHGPATGWAGIRHQGRGTRRSQHAKLLTSCLIRMELRMGTGG